jgi:hypothetical protein
MLKRDVEDERPRILGARFGVNPNSSSLGVDVTFLLLGGTAAIAASIALSALLRGRRWFDTRKASPPTEPVNPEGR